MKKLIAFLFFFGACSAELPNQFCVVERVLSLTSTFDICSDEKIFAIAHKRFLATTTTFDLEDGEGQSIATATARYFAWGTAADLVDSNGELIGSIEEEVVRILPWAEYRVFNRQNQIVAIAKMNFWGTCFELTAPNNLEDVYATIHRPFFQIFRDHWTVEILKREIFDEGQIDPRLLLTLAIYQTDKDHRDRFRHEITNLLTHELEYYKGRRID